MAKKDFTINMKAVRANGKETSSEKFIHHYIGDNPCGDHKGYFKVTGLNSGDVELVTPKGRYKLTFKTPENPDKAKWGFWCGEVEAPNQRDGRIKFHFKRERYNKFKAQFRYWMDPDV